MCFIIFFSINFLVDGLLFFFFFNDTATTEIYTLSLHDALPISASLGAGAVRLPQRPSGAQMPGQLAFQRAAALDVERLVDRLVRHPHLRIAGELLAQP